MRILAVLLMAVAMGLGGSEARAGYTHYFTWRGTPNEAELKACVADMRRIVEARKKILVAPDLPSSPPGAPVLGDASVDLNGIGDDAHEPFVFPGAPGFNFCKTLAKPYDEVVTACLLVARDHFPPSKLAISSDGSWDDWVAGAALYSSVMGRRARNPMSDPLAGVGTRPTIILLVFGAAVVCGLIAAGSWFKKKRLGIG